MNILCSPLGYLLLVFLQLNTFVYSQDKTIHEGFDFFSSEEILHVSLGFDMRSFILSREEPKSIEALLTVYEKSDTIMQFVKVKARGEMRRKHCSFPPLTIKLKKAPNIKLVTHCRNSDMYVSYVFKEYLAYKLYNLVTPYSFKTRLVQIDYIDVKTPGRIISEYGFLIEPEDQMASRNKAMVLDNDNISQRHMNAGDMARVALFNYMIGNTDWSVLNQHNIKILRSMNVLTGEGIPVAYDFDYSGFVSTAYSAPAKDLPIKTVSERYYQGNCISPEQLEPVIEEFESLKPKFIETIHDFDLLSENARKKLEYYINGFYKSYKHQDVLVSELNKTCRRVDR